MIRHWRHDRHRIDVCCRDDIVHLGCDSNTGVSAQDSCQCRRVLIAYGHDFAVLMPREVPHNVRPPIPVTDHAESYHGVLPTRITPVDKPSSFPSTPKWTAKPSHRRVLLLLIGDCFFAEVYSL